MHLKKWLLLFINIFGGIAVLGSYVQGILAHPRAAETLWGGVPLSIRPFYTAGMFLAAAGYFAFTYFILFRLDPRQARIFQRFGFGEFNALYAAILLPSALWMPLTFLSVALSAMVNVARVAAQETTSAAVTVLDSRQLSLGMGFLVEKAAQLAEAGSSLSEILAVLNDQIKRSHVFAALDTLEFMRRSGRINRFMSNLGGLMQIKPILTMYEGKPGTVRVRTREGAKKRLLEMLKEVGTLERLAIVHTNAPDRVAELCDQAASMLPDSSIMVADITPVIGVHIGPGAYGFAAVGK